MATMHPSEAGATPKTVEVQIGIAGMTCASCALRIEKGVKGLDGIETARVNFGTEKAILNLDPDQADLESLLTKIQDIG